MAPGTLRLFCGPMFAGKTTALLAEARRREGACIIFKPAMDVRYGAEVAGTHDGDTAAAVPIRRRPDRIPEGVTLVLLEEVQFMEAPWFDDDTTDWVSELLAWGIDVVAGGLDMDARGRPFEVTALLAAMADEVVKLKAKCVECGKPAGMTRRRDAGGPRVLLGGSEAYEAACREHHRGFPG